MFIAVLLVLNSFLLVCSSLQEGGHVLCPTFLLEITELSFMSFTQVGGPEQRPRMVISLLGVVMTETVHPTILKDAL